MNSKAWIAVWTGFFVVSSVLPVILTLAERYRLYDLPGPLKIHTRPLARLGGMAMTPALFAGVLLSGIGVSRSVWSFLAALATVWIINLGDDLYGLSAGVRLTGHVAAAFLLWQAGWRLPLPGPMVLNLVATCIFVAFLVSAFNMLDGSDGIAGGSAAIVALGYATLFGNLISHLGDVVAWSLVGACVGFLLFNFPPAKIFMGDSGSAMLGFVVAFLSLDFYRGEHASRSYLLIPLLLCAIPLSDASCAIVRRLRTGTSPFAGDRQHFYDLLLRRGWSPRRVALCSYAATGSLVFLGWLCHRVPFAVPVAVLAVTTSLMFASIRSGLLRWPAGSPLNLQFQKGHLSLAKDKAINQPRIDLAE